MTGVRPVRTRQAVEVRIVTGAELVEHHRIRHAVFVVEQEIFAGSTTDYVPARRGARSQPEAMRRPHLRRGRS